MTYDLEQLRGIIKDMRSRFKTLSVISALVLIIGIAIAVFSDGITLRFIGAATVIIAVCFYLRVLRRYQPAVLFRRELRGINIKEHEFLPLGNQRRALYRYTGFRRAGDSGAAYPRGIRAELYLKDECGEIHPVLGLSKTHTDIYEDGDELLRPAGCVYPIILGRSVEKQPCPICGRINSCADTRCPVCRLDIIKVAKPR